VQVDMLSLATNGIGREVRIACRLKEAGEVIQLDKLAFCLAHPALHRKLNFALSLKHAGWIGGSIDVPLHQRRHLHRHRRGGLDRDGGVARSGEGASLGAGAVEGAGDHHAGRIASGGV
jgi:hypothetical protein